MSLMRRRLHLILLISALALNSCSTTRVLKNDELRLDKNDIIITNDTDFQVSTLAPYLKQQPNSSILGFKPLLYVYNWSNGSDNGLNKLWKQLGEAPVVFDQGKVELSKRNIANRVTNLGYYNSKVESELRLKEQEVEVKYYVTLGNRYVIDTVIYNLPPRRHEFREDFLADVVNSQIKKGTYLSEIALNAEIDRSVSALREEGYFALNKTCYSFQADTLAGNGMAVLEYTIREMDSPLRKVKIGNVDIVFPENLNIDTTVLKGVNLIEPGALYSESKVSDTYTRFSSLKIFKTVGIDMNQVSDDKVNCEINLTKSQPQGFKTNLEVSTNSSGLMGISPQLNFYHKNIFGGGEWLNVGFVGNFQFRTSDNVSSNEIGTSLNLSFPKFLGLDYKYFKGPNIPRTEINASFNYQNRPEYTRNVASTSFGYSGALGRRFYYQIYPLQFSYVRLFNLNPDFLKRLEKNPFMKYSYQDHCDLGIGSSIFYNSSTAIVPKTDYCSIRFSGDLSGNFLSLFSPILTKNDSGERLVLGAPYSQYARVEGSYAQGFRVGKDESICLAFRLLSGIGVAYGNSTALPYEKQFYCGGASSMRGWQARALGPGASPMDKTFSIPSQTGDIKLEADFECRFPIYSMFEGALFAEVGNVWKRESGIKLEELAADWGLGLRINLDFLVVRVDWGIRLRDPSLEGEKWISPAKALKNNWSALHFGVGYPF